MEIFQSRSCELSVEHTRHLHTFYRQNKDKLGLKPQDRLSWCVFEEQIVCCVRWHSMKDQGWQMRSLLTHKDFRHQGFARRLLVTSLPRFDLPIWLLCRPQLQDFYRSLGFQSAGAQAPQTLLRQYHKLEEMGCAMLCLALD